MAVTLLIPIFPGVGDYLLHVLTLILLYMILALGLNVVPGFTGLLDLGYVGFYSVGAYTSGLLTLTFSQASGPLALLGSFWVILPLAALHGALWGILRGAPTLRLTGDYFAIVTFGFSELVVLIITNETWLTRGPMGLPGILPPQLGPYTLWWKGGTYYLALGILCLTVLIMKRLEDSRLGRAWLAIREDEVAAEVLGINVGRYKLLAFAVSSAFGAMAGAFFARWVTFVSPNMFRFWESILILCMIVLGGMGSIHGALVGAGFLVALSELLRVLLPPALVSGRYLLYGLILVIMMRYRPEGLFPVQAGSAEVPERADQARD